MKRFLLYWIPLLAWMGLIFALSAQPDLPRPPGLLLEKLFDKAAHVVTYGILAWLLLRALRLRCSLSAALLIAVVALVVAYGIGDEYHQSFVPGRDASLADVAADGVGAALAMAAAAWLAHRRGLGRPVSEAQ